MISPCAEVELVRIDPEKAPLARWGHTATLIGKELFIFGGYGANETHLNSVDIFNTETLDWTHVPGDGNNAPEGRDSHSASAIGPNIFILGGTTGTANIALGDISVLNTPTRAWFKASALGTVPTPREGHTATCVGDRIFVFGGSFSSQAFNDVCVYDTKSQSWSMVPMHGKPPSPRDSHTATLIKNRFIVIFGGDTGCDYCNDLHVLDTQSMSWLQPRLSGQPPSPRAGHVAALVDHHNILICGGGSEDGSLNDVHVLDTRTYTWMEVSTGGNGWVPRFGHSAALIRPNKVLIFGGNDASKPLNDIYLLTFYADMALPVVKTEEDAAADTLGAPVLNYSLAPPANGLLARARDAAAAAATASAPNARPAAQQPWQQSPPVAIKDEEAAIVRTYTVRVQRPSEELVRTMQTDLQRLGFAMFKPNNTFFSARKEKKSTTDSTDSFAGVSTVLYTSGALVVHGLGKEAFINNWLTPLLNKIGVKCTIEASQPRSKRPDDEGGVDRTPKSKRLRQNKSADVSSGVMVPHAAAGGVQLLRSASAPDIEHASEPPPEEAVVLPLPSNPGAFDAATEFRGCIESVFELGYFASLIVNGCRYKAMLVRGSNARPIVRDLPAAALPAQPSPLPATMSSIIDAKLDRNMPLSSPPKSSAAVTYSADQPANATPAAPMQPPAAGYSVTSPFLKPPLAQVGRLKPAKESVVEKNIYRAASSYLPPCPPQTASGGSVTAKQLQNPYSVHNVPLPIDHTAPNQHASALEQQQHASLHSSATTVEQQRHASDGSQVHSGDTGGQTPFSTQYHTPLDDDSVHHKKQDDRKDASIHPQHTHLHHHEQDTHRPRTGAYHASRGDGSSAGSLFRGDEGEARQVSKTSGAGAYQGDLHSQHHPNVAGMDFTTTRSGASMSPAGGHVGYGAQHASGPHYPSTQTSGSYREDAMSAGHGSRYAGGMDTAERAQSYHSGMGALYDYGRYGAPHGSMQQHAARKQANAADTSGAGVGSAASATLSSGTGSLGSDVGGTQYGSSDRYASHDALAFPSNNFPEMAGAQYGGVAASQGSRAGVQSGIGVAGMGDLSTFNNFESFYSDASDPRRA